MGKRPDTQQPNGHSDSSDDRRQNEDPDATIIDVFNTNRALFPGGRVSGDESSGFSNTDDGEERMLKCYEQYPENVKTPIRKRLEEDLVDKSRQQNKKRDPN